MITVLVEPGTLEEGARVALATVEVHHLRVRRAGAEATVRLTDGEGAVATGKLWMGRGEALVDIAQVTQVPRPLPLVIALAAGDRERFAWFMEKAAELGVTDVVPLETERTRDVSDRLRAGQLERLRRRALEAVKQCGAAWAPELSPPVTLAEFARSAPQGRRWLAALEGGLPPAGMPPEPITIVVGPEGGLTPDEREILVKADFRPTRFGEHVLRFETAALAAAVHAAIARKRGVE